MLENNSKNEFYVYDIDVYEVAERIDRYNYTHVSLVGGKCVDYEITTMGELGLEVLLSDADRRVVNILNINTRAIESKYIELEKILGLDNKPDDWISEGNKVRTLNLALDYSLNKRLKKLDKYLIMPDSVDSQISIYDKNNDIAEYNRDEYPGHMYQESLVSWGVRQGIYNNENRQSMLNNLMCIIYLQIADFSNIVLPVKSVTEILDYIFINITSEQINAEIESLNNQIEKRKQSGEKIDDNKDCTSIILGTIACYKGMCTDHLNRFIEYYDTDFLIDAIEKYRDESIIMCRGINKDVRNFMKGLDNMYGIEIKNQDNMHESLDDSLHKLFLEYSKQILQENSLSDLGMKVSEYIKMLVDGVLNPYVLMLDQLNNMIRLSGGAIGLPVDIKCLDDLAHKYNKLIKGIKAKTDFTNYELLRKMYIKNKQGDIKN